MNAQEFNDLNLLFIVIDSPGVAYGPYSLNQEIDDESARKVYIDLLFKSHLATKDINAEKAVFYLDSIDYDDVWENAVFCKELMLGRNRLEQLKYAFNYAFFSGYQKVVMPRPDVINLKQDHMLSAFLHLDKYDVVFGPAKQGGFYLIGMKKPHAFIFDAISEPDDVELGFFLKLCAKRELSVLVLDEMPTMRSLDDFKYLSSDERTRYHQLVGVDVHKERLRNQIASFISKKSQIVNSSRDHQEN